MSCTSGCPTPGAHATWGECLRGKSLRIAYSNSASGWDATRQKRFEAENAAYRQAVSDGLQPKAVSNAAVNAAYERAAL